MYWSKEHNLTPYNVYSKNNDDDWDESDDLCDNSEFWEEEMVSLYKEENPEWEMDEEHRNRLREIEEISSKYSLR